MAQRAVVYRFMLREWRNPHADHRLLGSIDNAGTRLYDILPELLESIHHMTSVDGLEEPQPEVTFREMVYVDGFHCNAALLNHYQYGSSGILNRYDQGDRTPFNEIDNQQTTAAIIISAYPTRSVGFLGIQIPNRRGVKTGVESELRRLFRDQFGLHLTIEPVVPLDAVARAIEQSGVGVVSFRRLNNPTDLFADDSEWWTSGGELGRVELRLSPPRFGRLIGRKIVRFIRSQEGVETPSQEPITFDELATIQGQTYDELSVEVFLDGRKKVMRIDPNSHWMSHAFSWELPTDSGHSPAQVVAAIAELLPE